MLANSVSPPTSGMVMPRNTVTEGGCCLKVMSECQTSILDGLSRVLSRIMTSGNPSTVP